MYEGRSRELWEHTSTLLASWSAEKISADQLNPWKVGDAKKTTVVKLTPEESIDHLCSLFQINRPNTDPTAVPPIPTREQQEQREESKKLAARARGGKSRLK